MALMKTPVSDAAYRNIWNECIHEEFVDHGSNCMVDAASNFIDESILSICSCAPPCQRGICHACATENTPLSSNPSSVVSFAFFSGHDFSPIMSCGQRATPIFRGKVQQSSSPTISVAELGDSLFAKGSPLSSGHSSLPYSPCSSPASSDISLPSTSRARQAHPTSSMSEEEYEEDIDSDSDLGEDDDEYRPFRATHARSGSLKQPSFAAKQAAIARSPPTLNTRNSGTRTTTRRPPQKHARKPAGSKKPAVQRSKPRAKQVDASVPFLVPDDFRCLHCDFEQSNHRLQDFKRHVTAHFRSIIYWDCCGVPASEAASYGISGSRNPLERDGVTVVGGCGRDFGRKDAYKRHLDDSNNSCVGDIDASWHPGNAYKDFGDD